MAEAVHVTDSWGDYWYIDSSRAADVLTKSQMETNVTYFNHYITVTYPTWTTNSIAAMCGNAQSEGALNPSQWQYGGGMSTSLGYGLFQWTPATKFLDWAADRGLSRYGIRPQVDRVEYERAVGGQWIKTSRYPITFTQFLTGNYELDFLARAWLYNYERPKNPAASENIRVERSRIWYEYISGEEPGPGPSPDPDPVPIGSTGFKSWLYHRYRFE